MKSVLISIQPFWVFLIIAKTIGWNIDKKKTIEVRKNYPKDEKWDKVAKIYCSKDKKSFAKIPKEYQPFMERFLGKVIGEFVCDVIYETEPIEETQTVIRHYPRPWWYNGADDCLHHTELEDYLRGKVGYGWHISNLVIYDKPRELSEFHKPTLPTGLRYEDDAITRPPQSWCYVESEVQGE